MFEVKNKIDESILPISLQQGAVVRNAIAIAFQKIWRFIRTAITYDKIKDRESDAQN